MASWFTIGLILITGFFCISCRFEVRKLIATTPSTEDTKDHLNYQNNDMNITELTESNLGLPDELKAIQPLWEVSQSPTSNNPASISRIYEDGRLYTWSNSRRVISNGKVRRESAPYAWRLDAQINPEGINRLQALISTEFVKLPSNNTVTTALDQGYIVWKSRVNSQEHNVILPASAYSELPQVIRDIEYAIQSNIIPGAVPQTQP